MNTLLTTVFFDFVPPLRRAAFDFALFTRTFCCGNPTPFVWSFVLRTGTLVVMVSVFTMC